MIIVYADGGTRNNGTDRASSYYSFKVFTSEPLKERRHVTGDLPEAKTSPEAEFNALIHTLKYLKDVLKDVAYRSQIEIRMDSALVVDAISGQKNIKARNLIPLLELAKLEISQVNADINLVWRGKPEILAMLGH